MRRTRTILARNMESTRPTSSHSTSMQSRKSQAHTVTENLLRTQGPDGGFHTGYDQAGTYAGTQENAETTSIVMIAISNLSITGPFPFPFFPRPSWIIYLYIGLAVVAVGVVITVLVLEQRKRKPVVPNYG